MMLKFAVLVLALVAVSQTDATRFNRLNRHRNRLHSGVSTYSSAQMTALMSLKGTIINSNDIENESYELLEVSRVLTTEGSMDINAWQIGRWVASGGFGVVYESRRIADQTLVAVKVGTRNGLVPEANAYLMIPHQCDEYAVKMLDHGEWSLPKPAHFDIGGVPEYFIVTEWMDGGDARGLAAQWPAIKYGNDGAALTSLIIHLSKGLSCLHTEAHFSHNDIKAENLFVSKPANGAAWAATNVKFADFGTLVTEVDANRARGDRQGGFHSQSCQTHATRHFTNNGWVKGGRDKGAANSWDIYTADDTAALGLTILQIVTGDSQFPMGTGELFDVMSLSATGRGFAQSDLIHYACTAGGWATLLRNYVKTSLPIEAFDPIFKLFAVASLPQVSSYYTLPNGPFVPLTDDELTHRNENVLRLHFNARYGPGFGQNKPLLEEAKDRTWHPVDINTIHPPNEHHNNGGNDHMHQLIVTPTPPIQDQIVEPNPIQIVIPPTQGLGEIKLKKLKAKTPFGKPFIQAGKRMARGINRQIHENDKPKKKKL